MRTTRSPSFHDEDYLDCKVKVEFRRLAFTDLHIPDNTVLRADDFMEIKVADLDVEGIVRDHAESVDRLSGYTEGVCVDHGELQLRVRLPGVQM